MRWIGLSALVVLVEALVFCGIYYMRITDAMAAMQSDTVLFIVPAVAAASLAGYLFWGSDLLRTSPALRLVAAIVWGIAASITGLAIGGLVAFNRWGT